jgi:cysteine desulfurase
MDRRVFEAMMPYFTERFGNAASLNHSFGWEAQDACELARERIAAVIHAGSAREVIFTSGGEESNTLAIKGTADAYARKGNHIITSLIEQPSVLDACRSLECRGYEVTYLAAGPENPIDPETIKKAITDQTILISITMATEDPGTIQKTAEIGQIANASGVLFHADGAFALGKIPVNVQELGINLLSITGETIYGPREIGALYVRSRKPRGRLTPLIDGGGQERGWRSGTLNVPCIVGLGVACALCEEEMQGKHES